MVTSASGGKHLRGVTVCAHLVEGSSAEGEELSGGCAQTTSDGEYMVENLDPGIYVVEFSDTGKYETQFYDGVASAAEATPVAVAVEAATEDINAAMFAAGKGTGTAVKVRGGSTGNTGSTGGGGYQSAVRLSPTLGGAIGVRPELLRVPLRCAMSAGRCSAGEHYGVARGDGGGWARDRRERCARYTRAPDQAHRADWPRHGDAVGGTQRGRRCAP